MLPKVELLASSDAQVQDFYMPHALHVAQLAEVACQQNIIFMGLAGIYVLVGKSGHYGISIMTLLTRSSLLHLLVALHKMT